MARIFRHLFSMATLAASASAQAANPPLQLEPSSAWVLDYQPERCSLNRRFAQGTSWVHMRIDSYGSRSTLRVLLFGPGVPPTRRASEEVAVRLTPDLEPRPTNSLNGSYDKDPATSFSITFRPKEPDDDILDGRNIAERTARMAQPKPSDTTFESQTNSLEVEFWNRRKLTLAVGNMAPALTAMRTCLDNLRKYWGFDPEREKTLTRFATPKPQAIRRLQDNYPASMLASGLNAYVPVRVTVDQAGNPTACVVQTPSVEKAFQDAVCNGLAKTYDPALDRDGNPVASLFVTAVVYQIAW